MNQSATITSKMQLTIPMVIARKVGLESGDKVTLSEEGGKIILIPMKQLITELSGALSVPKEWRGKDVDMIIQQAKAKHFQHKKI